MTLSSRKAAIAQIIGSLSGVSNMEWYGRHPDPKNRAVGLVWPRTLTPESPGSRDTVTWECALGFWRESLDELVSHMALVSDSLMASLRSGNPQCLPDGSLLYLESLDWGNPQSTSEQAHLSNFRGVWAVLGLNLITE